MQKKTLTTEDTEGTENTDEIFRLRAKVSNAAGGVENSESAKKSS
jgi:hypothetical protein